MYSEVPCNTGVQYSAAVQWNAAWLMLRVRLLVRLVVAWESGMLQRPPEKCQKSNREIWKSVRASSQEIHPETCNEENNGLINGERSLEIFPSIPGCSDCHWWWFDTALEFCNSQKKKRRSATNLSLGSKSCNCTAMVVVQLDTSGHCQPFKLPIRQTFAKWDRA